MQDPALSSHTSRAHPLQVPPALPPTRPVQATHPLHTTAAQGRSTLVSPLDPANSPNGYPHSYPVPAQSIPHTAARVTL